jgi:hypothetical protein
MAPSGSAQTTPNLSRPILGAKPLVGGNKAGAMILPQARLAVMNARVERCRKKAVACERAAETLRDPATKALYLDLARQWRRLARQAEQLEHEHRNGD